MTTYSWTTETISESTYLDGSVRELTDIVASRVSITTSMTVTSLSATIETFANSEADSASIRSLNASSTSAPIFLTTPLATSAPDEDQSSHDRRHVSAGAAAGIGVAVTFSVAICSSVAFICIRRSRHKATPSRGVEEDQPPELDAGLQQPSKGELDTYRPPGEMDGSTNEEKKFENLSELDSPELPKSSRCSELEASPNPVQNSKMHS